MRDSLTNLGHQVVQRVLGRPNHKLAPRVSGHYPYFGHAVELARAPMELLARGVREHGEIFSFQLIGQTVTVMVGPDAHAVFFGAPDHQLDPLHVHRFYAPLVGQGISYQTLPKMTREQLELIEPAFDDHHLGVYAPWMITEAQRITASWAEEGVFDLPEACAEVTIAAIVRCIFGPNTGDSSNAEITHLCREAADALHHTALLAPHLPLPAQRRYRHAIERLETLLLALVRQRRGCSTREEDALRVVMRGRYADGKAATDEDLVGLLLPVLIGACRFGTALSTWTGVLLHQHPYHVPALLEEQLELLGTNRSLTYTSLQQATRLRCAVLEAARMRPPLVMLMRKALEDLHYGDYLMPAGQLVMVCPEVAQRDPAVFADPDRFDPDRFASPREEDQRPFGLITWGIGGERVWSKTLGMLQAEALWSVWLSAFDFELLDTDLHLTSSASSGAGPGSCRMRYRRRQHPLGAEMY